MNSSMTRLSIRQLEDRFSARILKSYQGMADAPDLIRFLENPEITVTFRFALCRFLRRQYGRKNPGSGFTLLPGVLDLAVSSDASPAIEDVESYIALMLHLSEARGMKGELQGKHLRLYLLGKQEKVSRETLFKMAFAFDMDTGTVCELLEALDELPYNFRSAKECICYFCQYSGDFNSWAQYQEMCALYEAAPDARAREEQAAGQSRLMEDTIEQILMQDLAPGEMKKAFMDHLLSQKGLFTGYSLSAYEEFDALADELIDLTGASDDTDLVIRLWEPLWVQFYTRKGEKTGKNRSDFVPWKGLLDLPRTICEKPLWRARIQKIRSRKIPVEKRDLLFLNCMRWAHEGDSEGGKEALSEFITETNDILLRSGLAAIYPPNPYDRMILLSVCSPVPYEVLSDIFSAATDEEKLSEKLAGV